MIKHTQTQDRIWKIPKTRAINHCYNFPEVVIKLIGRYPDLLKQEEDKADLKKVFDNHYQSEGDYYLIPE